MPDDSLPPPPKKPAAPAPRRLPLSVRRTSSIDVDWPGGQGNDMRLSGRARDVFTPASGGAPVVLAEDSLEATVSLTRQIVAIDSRPRRADIQQLVGARGGGHLRSALDEVLPDERRRATPLHLLIDDISGASLIASWAWSLWDPQWLDRLMQMKSDPQFAKEFDREGICTGLRPGSSGLRLMAEGAPTADLRRLDDPQGWHEFPLRSGPAMRRARRIDVTIDECIRIDAAFQDSASTPDGPRAALHEYCVTATGDPVTFELVALEAEPRVLPFAECPAAAANVTRLLGTPLHELRENVLAHLRGTAGCTHLNDALRDLAEVPALVQHLLHKREKQQAHR